MSSFDEHDDLKDLRDLARDHEPPAELEERTVETLRDRKLIGPEARESVGRVRSRWAVAAALVVAVLGGWTARALIEKRPAAGVEGDEYLVVLTEPNGLQTPKSVQELVGEYRAWATETSAAGHLVSGRRLLDGGRRLSRGESGGIEVSQETSKTQPTGYFLIRAQGWQEAVELLQDNPHLAYGGEISLRKIARDG